MLTTTSDVSPPLTARVVDLSLLTLILITTSATTEADRGGGQIWAENIRNNAKQSASTSPFAIQPHNLTAVVGSTVVLPCRVNNPDHEIQWTHVDFGYGTTRELEAFPRARMIGDDLKRDYNLEITNVEIEDSGDFECQISGTTFRSNKAYLQVHMPPKSVTIASSSSSSSKSPTTSDMLHSHLPVMFGSRNFLENEEYNLTCKSTESFPPAKITWLDRDNNILTTMSTTPLPSSVVDNMPNDGRIREIESHVESVKTNETGYDWLSTTVYVTSSTISIVPTRLMNNATFKCVASNEVGRSMPAQMQMNVRYAPRVTVVADKAGPIAEGRSMGFTCISEANPAVYTNRHIWSVMDRDSDNVRRKWPKELTTETGSRLVLRNLTRYLHGSQIKCLAENALGLASATLDIEVSYSPRFVVQPEDTAVNRSEAAVLRCAVDSNPPAQYYWVRYPDLATHIGNSPNLTLPPFGDSSSAENDNRYQCFAHAPNFETIGSRVVQVTVKTPPIVTAASIQQLKSQSAGMEGGILAEYTYLDCEARSMPVASHIEWAVDGLVIKHDGVKYRVVNVPMERGIRSTLVIMNPTSADLTTYSCRFENNLGSNESFVRLTLPESHSRLIFVTSVILVVLVVALAVACCILTTWRSKAQMQRTNRPLAGQLTTHEALDPVDDHLSTMLSIAPFGGPKSMHTDFARPDSAGAHSSSPSSSSTALPYPVRSGEDAGQPTLSTFTGDNLLQRQSSTPKYDDSSVYSTRGSVSSPLDTPNWSLLPGHHISGSQLTCNSIAGERLASPVRPLQAIVDEVLEDQPHVYYRLSDCYSGLRSVSNEFRYDTDDRDTHLGPTAVQPDRFDTSRSGHTQFTMERAVPTFCTFATNV